MEIVNYLGFPSGSDGKESAYNAGDLGSIPGLGRSPGEGNGYPLQYSGLESSMDSPWHCKEFFLDPYIKEMAFNISSSLSDLLHSV